MAQLLPRYSRRLDARKCRLCGTHNGPGVKITKHHLIPLRQRRQNEDLNIPENIVSLCERCHLLIESKERSGGHVHRQRLRARLTRAELEWALSRSREWFERTYPPAG